MARQIIAALLLVAGFAVFVGLGIWQLQRLEWKQGIIAEIEAQIAAAPGPLPAAPDPEADKYRPVEIAGAFGPQELLVLVSSRDYGPGFRVIAPFITGEGRRIMVDRGFIPTEAREAARSVGQAEIAGNLHWPDERNGSTPEDDVAGNWWYARDVDKMAAVLGAEPVLVIAASQTDPAILPMPVDTSAVFNRHLEYAMTWFLFAATWVVMTGFALWRIRRRNG
ncbi:SURF1 family protein [Sinisalibacter aestuarii]|uniref:SURF1-like protein n=1 Tax=Sinisalibacter aestuarii TaxID=2949426 RepID=A0ABQ5LX06_9RHOB|nr:SURF1 family protein [Sinisalibacter aestuarii]GKY89517.1 SURF1-like protein [Sinisalibacter aestuarii]